MHKPNYFIRVYVVIALTVGVIALGYPTAFVVQHGWNPAAWPSNVYPTPTNWFQELSVTMWAHYVNVPLIIATYMTMLQGMNPAFAGGGYVEVAVLGIGTIFVSTMILSGGKYVPLRDISAFYGSAQWASRDDLDRMNKGLEIGLDPDTGSAIRIQVEGNLITIAPPRTGKTQGFIIPNLAFPEPNAWAGPAVVIDPKGDVYNAVKRRRRAMGKTVRCLDPLNCVGGKDRWNPLSRIDPHDVLYLQSMALALLPQTSTASEASAYFRTCAVDVIVGAILASIRNGRSDPVGAATLLTDEAAFLRALENCGDASAEAARQILRMKEEARGNIISTARQATQWLRDERMQAVVQDHTFELSDLASGDVDLFIVLPADDSKKILAPYVRWLLADLFASVRRNKPSERIIAFIDEAFVLGRFDAILEGAGELPGYGISLWTFWQSRAQMIETYGEKGADTLFGTAEMTNVFNPTAALPDELEHWSKAIGTFTGVKETTTKESRAGATTQSRTPEARRLVAASDLPNFLKNWQVMFLTSLAHTPDPVKLGRTVAWDDPRFEGLIDKIPPVGKTA